MLHARLLAAIAIASAALPAAGASNVETFTTAACTEGAILTGYALEGLRQGKPVSIILSEIGEPAPPVGRQVFLDNLRDILVAPDGPEQSNYFWVSQYMSKCVFATLRAQGAQ